MIKKVLKKVLLGSLVIGSSLMANGSEYLYNTKSLVGFEGGFGGINVKGAPINDGYVDIGHGGVKIGAQTEDYRLFLSGRYFAGNDFNKITTLGAELDYMFHVASFLDFYLGVNGGLVSIDYDDVANVNREISDVYYGGQLGAKLIVTDWLDLDLGARLMSIQVENTQNSITYSFDDIVSGYVSVIFKYEMD